MLYNAPEYKNHFREVVVNEFRVLDHGVANELQFSCGNEIESTYELMFAVLSSPSTYCVEPYSNHWSMGTSTKDVMQYLGDKWCHYSWAAQFWTAEHYKWVILKAVKTFVIMVYLNETFQTCTSMYYKGFHSWQIIAHQNECIWCRYSLMVTEIFASCW